METNWAADHLQTIRTLMERSGLYRRALAPIMILNGVLGLMGGAVGTLLKLTTPLAFVIYWLVVAVAALLGSFMLARRQALNDSEPFWSPPTKRVAQALAPAFFAGLAVVVPFLLQKWNEPALLRWLPLLWTVLYGLGLNAAGFFMHRGIRLFGWGFVLIGCALLLVGIWWTSSIDPVVQAHLVMGALFGGLHLAYGTYLYFTEQRKTTA